MNYTMFVGFDVHKDSITVAVAKEGRDAPESLGTITNSPEAFDVNVVPSTVIKTCGENVKGVPPTF